jgi:hypothetical protein
MRVEQGRRSDDVDATIVVLVALATFVAGFIAGYLYALASAGDGFAE